MKNIREMDLQMQLRCFIYKMDEWKRKNNNESIGISMFSLFTF